jgi:hypothetical protein
MPFCLSFRSAAEESAFMFFSPTFRNCHPSRSGGPAVHRFNCLSLALAVVQVFAVILSRAKDPDELDAPLQLESFNQQFLKPSSYLRLSLAGGPGTKMGAPFIAPLFHAMSGHSRPARTFSLSSHETCVPLS